MKYLLLLLILFFPVLSSAKCYKVAIHDGYSDFVKDKRAWQSDTMLGHKFDVDLDPESPQLRGFKDRVCEITGPNMMVCNLKHYELYLTETWLIAPHMKSVYTSKMISGGESDSQALILSGEIIGECTQTKNNS